MIIIKDENTELSYEINIKDLQHTIHNRIETLCKIIDDKNITSLGRDVAYNELVAYQEEIQNLNELLKVSFDVLMVIEKVK